MTIVNKENIYEMIDRLKTMFKENAIEDTAEWYNNVAQGIAFATNSIQQTDQQTEEWI